MPRPEEAQPALTKLTDSRLAILRPEEDVRDRSVVDRDGERIGTVDALFVDEQERKVRFLDVGSGGFLGIGEQHFLVPVDAITAVSDEAVLVDLTRDRVREVPVYDPELAEQPDLPEIYGWYGYAPFWTPGYAYPLWTAPPPGGTSGVRPPEGERAGQGNRPE